jgi:nitrate reductase gamma subunit
LAEQIVRDPTKQLLASFLLGIEGLQSRAGSSLTVVARLASRQTWHASSPLAKLSLPVKSMFATFGKLTLRPFAHHFSAASRQKSMFAKFAHIIVGQTNQRQCATRGGLSSQLLRKIWRFRAAQK